MAGADELSRVTVYVGEGDHHRGASLYRTILELLRREGAAGATATRALAGFGAGRRLHTETIEALSLNLPVRIEWVDDPARVEALLPAVRRLAPHALVTLETVRAVQLAGTAGDPLEQPVRSIMFSNPVTVFPHTPVADLVTLLLERGVRCLPVVETSQRLAGIITDADLLQRAGLQARLGLQTGLSTEQLVAQLAGLRDSPAVAADIMTQPVYSVQADDTVRAAVNLMVKHEVKRLPVIDATGRLVGILSRLDVFRTVSHRQGAAESDVEAPHTGRTVAELMHADVPTVSPAARLEEIVRALEVSRRRRAVVVDDERHVLGIITDGDLLRRSQAGQSTGLLQRLRSLVGGRGSGATVLPDEAETAAELMTAPALTVRLDTPASEALRLVTEKGVKRLPVVDGEGRLVGLLGRASLLRGLLGVSSG